MSEQEMIARALFQRFKERAACRLPEPQPGSYALDQWENLPNSFKRDFYDDAATILTTRTDAEDDRRNVESRHRPERRRGEPEHAKPAYLESHARRIPNPIRCRMTDLTELASRVEARIASRSQDFADAVEALPWVKERLDRGQQFNVYGYDEDDDDDDAAFAVALGPISDCAILMTVEPRAKAEMIASALTIAAALRARAAMGEG